MKPLFAFLLTCIIMIVFPMIILVIFGAFTVLMTETTWADVGNSQLFWISACILWFMFLCAGEGIYDELVT
jgi:hypothetical protein